MFIQDVLEFFLHLIDRVEKANPGDRELNPFSGFKFVVEERVQCPSGKVSYNKRSDNVLSLSIPLHEATNKGSFKNVDSFLLKHMYFRSLIFVGCAEQLEAFNEKKAAMNLDGKEV